MPKSQPHDLTVAEPVKWDLELKALKRRARLRLVRIKQFDRTSGPYGR